MELNYFLIANGKLKIRCLFTFLIYYIFEIFENLVKNKCN